MSLGEQIAVLDGLDAIDPTDGRLGQRQAAVTQYSTPVMHGVLARRNVLDASEGANYSGGSAYARGLPLGPSSWGLAGLGNIPNVLPTRRHVIDPSGGANYTGGSDWVPGLPLVASSAGLAADFIAGGYGRAGLGAGFIQGGYGRAGLGQTASAADEDLAGAAEAIAAAKAINPEDGRIGQSRAQVDEYGRPIMQGVLQRSNVLDASEGANYSGGSSYARGLPLMPSSVGLAGLGAYDESDGLSDADLAGAWGTLRRRAGMMATRAAARAAIKPISKKSLSRSMKRAMKHYNRAKRSTGNRRRMEIFLAKREGITIAQIKAARRRLFAALRG